MRNNYTVKKIKGKILLTKDFWKIRTFAIWNTIPFSMRRENEKIVFKGSLRTWIMQNTRLKY